MNRCVACDSILTQEHFVRMRGEKYQRVYYCDDRRCLRYGLLSIYKLHEEKAEEGKP